MPTDVHTTRSVDEPATPLIAFLLTTWRVANTGVAEAASTVATMMPIRHAAKVLIGSQGDAIRTPPSRLLVWAR